MGLFDKLSEFVSAQPAEPAAPASGKLLLDDFWVAGVYYHKDATQKLAVQNAAWTKNHAEIRKGQEGLLSVDRYHYKNEPVELVLETNNPDYKNAVRVEIKGQFVGYVPAENNRAVREVLKTGKIEAITAKIEGGEFRVLYNDGTEKKDSRNVRIHVLYAYRRL